MTPQWGSIYPSCYNHRVPNRNCWSERQI